MIMRKFPKFLLKVVSTILICFVVLKLNSFHYKKLADDRIGKVIELQEANLEEARIERDFYDYFESGYVKDIYFNDDPDIEYRYVYEKSRDMVYVSAFVGNASIDLTNKVAKYEECMDVYFNSDGNIERIEKR